MVITCKLNVCRITVASRLFSRNDYFPLIRVTTPAEAARDRCPDGVYRPRNHYMPVLLNSRSKPQRRKKNKPRPHSTLSGFKYMMVRLDGQLLELLEARPPCRLPPGLYAYRIEARRTCLLLDARLEEAARAGDIADLTIADHADRTVFRMRQGERYPAPAIDCPANGSLYEGEARTTREQEARHHHYGRATMAIASIFESKEKEAALEQLQRIQAEAKRARRRENEWKNGIASLIANLHHSGTVAEETSTKLATAVDVNMQSTLQAVERLQEAGHLDKLPPVSRVDSLVRHALADGRQCELAGATGALVTDCDGQQYFIVGQNVEMTGESVFVPGLTFQQGSLFTYMAGICVLVHDAPAFVAGAVFGDERGEPVFLPGQLIIGADGVAQVATPDALVLTCPVLQLEGEDRRQRVHRCRMQRKKLRREREKKIKATHEQSAKIKTEPSDVNECINVTNTNESNFQERNGLEKSEMLTDIENNTKQLNEIASNTDKKDMVENTRKNTTDSGILTDENNTEQTNNIREIASNIDKKDMVENTRKNTTDSEILTDENNTEQTNNIREIASNIDKQDMVENTRKNTTDSGILTDENNTEQTNNIREIASNTDKNNVVEIKEEDSDDTGFHFERKQRVANGDARDIIVGSDTAPEETTLITQVAEVNGNKTNPTVEQFKINMKSISESNNCVECTSEPSEMDMLRSYEDDIRRGVFLEEHDSHMIDLERERQLERAKQTLLEHEGIARSADDMNQVIDALEMKKLKLLEKLRDIQNETGGVPERTVTYVYPAKANALALELGMEGKPARAAAKLLLSVTRWASGYSAKFRVRDENVAAQPGELDLPSTAEVIEGAEALSVGLRTALRASMAAAVRVFKTKPRDLEAGMRAAGRELARVISQSERPLLQELTGAILSRTGQETNAILSDTITELSRKVVVNKAETLRSIIRDQFNSNNVAGKITQVIEDEGDILVRGFVNLSVANEEMVRAVHANIVLAEGDALKSEEESARAAHRALVDGIIGVHEKQLKTLLSHGSAHDIGHLLLEARSLALLLGQRGEARTIERFLDDYDSVGERASAADQVTLALVRRALVMRRLAEREPRLAAGLAAMRRSGSRAHNDCHLRELVLQSGALVSHSCPLLSSQDIPSFLWELSPDSLAMEDFLVRRVKRSGALLISWGGTQAVVPREASRFVLAGLAPYTLISERGVTHFKPQHAFSALKLDKKRESRYRDYSCLGAFDRYALEVPLRDSLDYPHRRFLEDHPCDDDVCNIGRADAAWRAEMGCGRRASDRS